MGIVLISRPKTAWKCLKLRRAFIAGKISRTEMEIMLKECEQTCLGIGAATETPRRAA